MKHESIDDEDEDGGRRGPPIRLILLLILVAALAVFFLQNTDEAPIQLFWLDVEWPIWIVIAISVLAGAVLDRLVTWQWRRARRRRRAAAG